MGDQHHSQSLPFLPDELIIHILPWLPVRSLLEFKRVCKSWQTIISNTQYTYNHLRNLTLNPSMTHQRVFCSRFNQKPIIVSFPIESLLETPSEPTELFEFNMDNKFRILGSCNGLLCLFHIDQGYVKLWNPCIRIESKKSPSLDGIDSTIMYYGFGYDHVNDKYKVLLSRRCTCLGKYEYVAQIYTFGENCWTTISNFPCITTTAVVGEFVGGTLNWTTFSVSSNKYMILSFNLEKETFKEVLLPDNDCVKVGNHVLGVLSNCLCVCVRPIKTNWNLWVMKKYGIAESWIKLTMIPNEQLRNCVNHTFYDIKPLFILKNDVVLLSTTTINTFVLFNLNNGRMDKCIIGCCCFSSKTYIYHASLVSPQL